MQYALESNPYDESSDGWLRQNTNLVLVGPDLTYYLKIRDGFYFTPGVAMFGTVGSVKVETRDIYVSKNVVGYGVELAPGAFEFRPTPHFALLRQLPDSGLFASPTSRRSARTIMT